MRPWTDAERWRFFADNSLVLNPDPREGWSVMHYTAPTNPGLAPQYRSVAIGPTKEEAIDRARDRFELKIARQEERRRGGATNPRTTIPSKE